MGKSPRPEWPGELGRKLPKAHRKREEAYRVRFELLFEHFGIPKNGGPLDPYKAYLGTQLPVRGYAPWAWQRLAIALADKCVPGLNHERPTGRPGVSWEDLSSEWIRPLAQLMYQRRALSLSRAIEIWQGSDACPFGKLRPASVVRQTAKARHRILVNARSIGHQTGHFGEAMLALDRYALEHQERYLQEWRQKLADAQAMPDDEPSQAVVLGAEPRETKSGHIAIAEAHIEVAERLKAEREAFVAGYLARAR